MPQPDTVTYLTIADLEALIRRVVREELAHAATAASPSLLDDWSHEGADDPAADAALLAEVLAERADERHTPTARVAWAAAQAELDRAEAAGELPD